MRTLSLLGMLGVAACGARDEGVAVTLTLRTQPYVVPSNMAVHWAAATVAKVELVACVSLASRVWQALSPIGVAYAHNVATPSSVEEAAVLRLDRAVTLELVTLHPPAGRYCLARVTFGPADDDALGLSPDDAPLIVGNTMHVELMRDGAPVVLDTAAVHTFDVELEDLTLDEEHFTQQLTLQVNAGTSLDEVRLDGPDAAGALLRGLTLEAATSPASRPTSP